MGEPGDKGFKVVDKRRVGREEEAPSKDEEKAGATATGPEIASDLPEDPLPLPEDRALGPIDFSTFIVSLASSALVHLGDAPNPESGKLEKSLAHGKQVIDLIGLLQEKTRGNLSEDEGRLLQALLLDLRLRFVEATKA
jgi:Domain of unknown function (DUF1844)